MSRTIIIIAFTAIYLVSSSSSSSVTMEIIAPIKSLRRSKRYRCSSAATFLRRVLVLRQRATGIRVFKHCDIN